MEAKGRNSVATLNIKNVPDPLYNKLRVRARRQRRSLAQEVIHLLSHAVEDEGPLSILDLRGLGKQHWRGVDPARHVAKERRSWD